MGTDSNDAMLARIARLEAEVQALRGRDERPPDPTATDDQAPVTRRRLIGLGGAAVAGAAGAVLASASPAGADDPDDLTIGVSAQSAGGNRTGITSNVVTETFRSDNTGGGGGVTGTSFSSTGVLGTSGNGAGVSGTSTNFAGVRATTTNGTALRIDAPGGTGVHAYVTPGAGTGPPIANQHLLGELWMDSVGILYQCISDGVPGTWVQMPQLGRDQAVVPTTSTRLESSGTQTAWWIAHSGSGTAVVGQSTSGIGVSGSTDAGIGIQANANNAANGVQLELLPTNQVGPPTGGAHGLGQFVMDQNGVLFQCVVAGTGTDAKWVRQSPLVPLAAPFRVYDSRVGQANPSGSTQGTLNFGGGARPINCLPTPNSTGATLPPTTSGLLFNVTLANTVGGVGSVVVWANGASEPSTASITWTGSGVVVGSAVTSACDAGQRVQIKTTTGSSTHVILDVIGFYV